MNSYKNKQNNAKAMKNKTTYRNKRNMYKEVHNKQHTYNKMINDVQIMK